jgi:hypothetical protein
MPYNMDDVAYIDWTELSGEAHGGTTVVPGLSRQTIRRLTRLDRWPPPATTRPRVSWRLSDVAAAMRSLAIPLPREWGLPADGEGGLDLRRWAERLPASGGPWRATELLRRWEADGGEPVRALDLGRGLAVLCGPGEALSRWRSNGGWLYAVGARPNKGMRKPKGRR